MFEDRPTIKELIEAVREFLEIKISPAVDKHTAFHTRVAINVLKIIERELELGPGLGAEEHQRLKKLLNRDGSLKDLNKDLCLKIQEGKIDYNNPDLIDHLKKTTLGRLSIDNPKYSAYRKAVKTMTLGYE